MRVNAISPVLAPPTQVDLKLPVGQVARAARMQPSQRPLETFSVAPELVGFKVNLAVPDTPVVLFGAPPHFWIEPWMPPQMARVATFMSWVSILLQPRVSLTRHCSLSNKKYLRSLVGASGVLDSSRVDVLVGANL